MCLIDCYCYERRFESMLSLVEEFGLENAIKNRFGRPEPPRRTKPMIGRNLLLIKTLRKPIRAPRQKFRAVWAATFRSRKGSESNPGPIAEKAAPNEANDGAQVPIYKQLPSHRPLRRTRFSTVLDLPN